MKVQVYPKSNLGRFALALALALTVPSLAKATPSTTFWAPSTPFVQPYGLLHITYDTYYRNKGAYPVDTGLTVGVLPFDKLQAEVGFDLFYPTINTTGATPKPVDWPLVLNGKFGSPEGAFGDWSPGWSAGIFGAGFEDKVTNANVLYFMLGKTFPVIGNPEIGVQYALNEDVIAKDRFGILAGWFSPAWELKKPYMEKIMLAWDLETGKNALGATGGGVYFYLTPMIDLLTGPVYYFEKSVQPGGSQWIWTMQLDIDMDLFTKKAE